MPGKSKESKPKPPGGKSKINVKTTKKTVNKSKPTTNSGEKPKPVASPPPNLTKLGQTNQLTKNLPEKRPKKDPALKPLSNKPLEELTKDTKKSKPQKTNTKPTSAKPLENQATLPSDPNSGAPDDAKLGAPRRKKCKEIVPDPPEEEGEDEEVNEFEEEEEDVHEAMRDITYYVRPTTSLTESDAIIDSSKMQKLIYSAPLPDQPFYHEVHLPRYTKIFNTQVEDGCKLSNGCHEPWVAGFVVKVLLMISAINFYHFAACVLPPAKDFGRRMMYPHFEWLIIAGSIFFLVALSVCSGIFGWNSKFPGNTLTLLAHILCIQLHAMQVTLWTPVWLFLSLKWPAFIPKILETIGFCSLVMAVMCRTYPKFNLCDLKVCWILALTLVSVNLAVTVAISFLGAQALIGEELMNLSDTITPLLLGNAIGGMIFLYICFDIHETLTGNRPVAWPHQWLYGVLLVHEDFVWIGWEALKLLLYILPCTYCKDEEHTIWKRSRCCRYNYRVNGNA